MPVGWICPGYPKCARNYSNPSAMKAHRLFCPAAHEASIPHWTSAHFPRRLPDRVSNVILFNNDPRIGSAWLTRSNSKEFSVRPLTVEKQWFVVELFSENQKLVNKRKWPSWLCDFSESSELFVSSFNPNIPTAENDEFRFFESMLQRIFFLLFCATKHKWMQWRIQLE